MKYVFVAKDASGAEKKGIVEAADRDLAARLLQKNELIPVSIERESAGFSIERRIQKMLDRVTQKELMIFFRQLSTLIEARVPVVSSLHAVGQQSENAYLRIILKQIADDIEDGLPLSDAFARFPETFSPFTVSMIRSGEVSGNLQKSVTFVADNIERNYVLTSRIRSALVYPAFVLSAAAIVGFIVVSFILPRLTVMIKDLGVAIPWYTTIIMNFGDFMGAYWWAVLILIIGCIGGAAYYENTEEGRRDWNELQLRIPVIGKLLRFLYIARFAENFSALLASGIPVVRALQIVADVLGNDRYRGIVLRAAEEVKVGKTISAVFSKTSDIPPIVTRMIAIGEETGKMNHVLDSVGRFYGQEVETTTRNLTSLLEPILIVGLGIAVGVLVVSVIMPIYNITGSIS